MRYFNIHGPVNEQQHYVVPRRQLVSELIAQIKRGSYFTIYAPRQMGKTTLLRRLEEILSSHDNFLPITFSLESSEGAPVADFLNTLYEELVERIVSALQSHPQVEELSALQSQKPSDDFYAYRKLFITLNTLTPKPQFVLIIDEFDGTPQQAISRLLLTWREIYLTQPAPRALQSVVLIGLQNIAALNLGRSSPFNIARQLQLSPFTNQQVQHLLEQHTEETGQLFEPSVMTEIYRLTNGHPFLVNRLAALLTEEIVTERSQAIRDADVQTALHRLLRERNYNHETLVRRASEYKEEVLRVLFGARLKFAFHTPWVNTLQMHGLIQENAEGFCDISNPIYKRILTHYFQPLESDLQAAILVNSYDLRQHVIGDELEMDALLSRFREFVERRGREAFIVTPMPQEATGQYLLMAYLDLVVRLLGGDLFTEVWSGEGRMDLIVVYRGHRYVIETKIWHGPIKFEQGVKQLEGYLETERQSVGYLVVFHARPRVYGKLTHKQLEFVLEREQAKIHVYLVRLGALFSKKKATSSKDNATKT